MALFHPRMQSVLLSFMFFMMLIFSNGCGLGGNKAPDASAPEGEGNKNPQTAASKPATSPASALENSKPSHLQQELSRVDNALSSQIPQEGADMMAAVTEKLRASGMTENALNVGDSAPNFELPNATRRLFSLSELLKNGPVVLYFYRGQWCPYCHTTLTYLSEYLPEIEKAGGTLIAISPQQPDTSMGERALKNLPFEVLTDSGNGVAKRFGIVFQLPPKLTAAYQHFGVDLEKYNGDNRHELPIPATYIVNTDGKIVYAFLDVDYKHRAEPSDVVRELKALQKN